MAGRIRNADDIKQLGTILSIWAHPDDETFMSAGIMVTALRHGQQVVCVTATRGEAGVQDEARWPAKDLGQIRTQELETALKILGVTEHHWLDYPDGVCDQVNLEEAAAKLRKLISKAKPDTILTFGPDGWSGHSDHKAISKWVDTAVEGMASPPEVYHQIQLKDSYDQYLKLVHDKFNYFFNVSPPKMAEESSCDCCYHLSPKLQHLKYEALKAMPSQYASTLEQFDKQYICSALARETFIKS